MAEAPPQKKTTYQPDEKKLEEIVLTSLANCEDKELAQDIASYIVQQFNSHTWEGWVQPGHFQKLLDTAFDGLIEIIYLKHYTIHLEKRDYVFYASLNLISQLATRSFNGIGYTKALHEIDARQPINIKN